MTITPEMLVNAAARPTGRVAALARWLGRVDDAALSDMAGRAAALTRHHFGRTMRLFAPLYLSNECINSCAYCGFSRENSILRVTLEIEEVAKEAGHLAGEGFRSILLVAGEHPKFVSGDYLERCLRRLAPQVPSLAIEVAPMEVPDYRRMVECGAEGLVVYQETYNQEAYRELHLAGPKKDFAWRLACPERGYEAGFRRIGVGALLGLADWRYEALLLAAHLDHLLRTCWKAHFTVSFPRLRPAAGSFEPTHPVSDREFIQLICAFRLAFPQVGIVLSTRESAGLRDVLAPLGITSMSAGSHTEPGGYTGQGGGNVHITVRGRAQAAEGDTADPQFMISDDRSAAEVSRKLRQIGLEPVWKDWDPAILGAAA
ncbi:MAG: 2-iminoacetate synthase ThiH [Terrimicrobiaceae bacterium]